MYAHIKGTVEEIAQDKQARKMASTSDKGNLEKQNL